MKYLLSTVIFILFSVYSFSQEMNDTLLIKKLLEKESATWRSGDIQGHADCWMIRPYSCILVSTTDGSFFNVNPALMLHPAPGSMGKGGTSVNSNYNFSIHGHQAWVSHTEISTSADGKKSWSEEIRMLEKINGAWKLVAQSIHMFQPK